MSGNLWMFSDMLDDEDIEMLKRDFITYYQGADYYGLGLKVFTRMAHEAGSVYKIGKKVLIRRSIFEEYLRQQCKSNDREKRLSLYEPDDEITVEEENDMMRQGILVTDLQSGRMDIRFSLEDYYEECIEKIGKVDYPCHGNAVYIYFFKVCFSDWLCAD